MQTITLYTFEDAEGDFGTFNTLKPSEAESYAREHNLRAIANHFTLSDCETAWDFTGEDEDEDEDEDEEE